MLLCIDDSQAILAYERSLFERSGFIVVTAPSAKEGLRLVTMYSFDAVLLDYHMPEMNGHHLASAIRRVRPDTPVVMFSGSEVPDETRGLVDAVVPQERSHRRTVADCHSTVQAVIARLNNSECSEVCFRIGEHGRKKIRKEALSSNR